MVKPCRNPSALLTRHSLSPIIKELRKKQQQLKQLKKIHKFYAKNHEDWDPETSRYVSFNSGEDIPKKLAKICRLVYNTPIYDRLKRERQLGSCNYVYFSATHTRFEHAVGTASITIKHVKKLQKLTLHRAAYHLTGSEMLAVTFAALLQNLGHPAFSYVYRECFDMPTHYEMAVKLFDKMLADEPRIKKELNKYFGDYHFTLIRQLINPPPMFDSEGKWNLVVSREKAYVFDIVNNRRNGLDADKLDYLYRDALRTGLESINMNIISRYIKSTVINWDPTGNFMCLVYPEVDVDDYVLIFESQKRLTKTLYYHKNVLAKDEMLKEAFKLAGPHLKIRTKEGEKIAFEKCWQNLDAYIQLTDDSIYERLLNPSSSHPDLMRAQKIIEDIQYRRMPKVVLEIESDGENNLLLCPENIKAFLQASRTQLRFSLSNISFGIKNLSVIQKAIHPGKGLNVNPLKNVLFYPRNDRSQTVLSHLKIESKICVYIFAPFECTPEDASLINKALKAYCKLHNLPQPIYTFRREDIF